MKIPRPHNTGLTKSHAITLGLILYDYLAILAIFLLSLWVTYGCEGEQIKSCCLEAYRIYLPYYALLSIFIYWRCKLYNCVWRFVSYLELFTCFIGTLLSVALYWSYNSIFSIYFPRRYYVIGLVLQFSAIFLIRVSYRFYRLLSSKLKTSSMLSKASQKGMIIGAGAAGQMILRDIITSDLTDVKIRCIIDDDQNKWGQFLEGVRIIGGREKIHDAVKKYGINVIFQAIPTLTAKEKKSLLELCKDTGCRVMTLPGMYQIVNGEVSLNSMREMTIEDLLGREPVKIDSEEVLEQLSGKVILVTGGGGSIGSELCRQIASYALPKQLIIFDVYENNAYDIENELKRNCPDLNLTVLIGSVRDSKRINSIFQTYKPEIVFHAAAHKHVPLMERSCAEAIKNNVFGTYNTANMAEKYGAEKFVLISTDKAVNPTNVMGASKRLCEMVIQCRRDSKTTQFVAVRFGNVLGSNGSVIPLFREQIKAGGPVTVTHPDIIRYFMIIPEAVSLVLNAGALAKGGEIFVLDMGKPVRIVDLAENLIRLSGFSPYKDIKLEFTGLRPGEKLYEELLLSEDIHKNT